MFFREVLGRDLKRALVIAAGGGGDVVGAYHTCLVLSSEGIEHVIGALPWERLVIDPTPGPIPLSDFRDYTQYRECLGIVTGQSYAVRSGRVVKPQICNLLSYVGGSGLVYDAYKPVDNIAHDIAEYCREHGIDLVIGVDVGGDIIADGSEETLLSPLADTYTLAVLKRVSDLGYPVVVGVYGPGCDGEIPRDEILRKLSLCAEKGEFLFFIGLTPRHAQVLEKICEHVHTEASKMPLLAYRGYYGKRHIRRQLREVFLDITVAGTYYITIRGAYMLNKMCQHVVEARSILHAREILHRLGVSTELDIEEEICKIGLDKVTPDVFTEIVRRLKQRVREQALHASTSSAL